MFELFQYERIFEILRQPVITEKATFASERNQLVFQVALNADKKEIKTAVETLFKVKVKKVNTLRQSGKEKKFKGVIGKRNEFKKAIITLEESHSIDVTTGI